MADTAQLVRDFHARGFAVVRGALSPAAVQSFLVETAFCLLRCQSDGGDVARIESGRPETWPRGRQRRVGEVGRAGLVCWRATCWRMPLFLFV
jgi:hypothetical protein